MAYAVQILEAESALAACPAFAVAHFQWTNRTRPQAGGRMGYLPGTGFLLQMECAEANPKRVYHAHQSPVCKDSAMEAFFCFAPVPLDEEMYLNFELNANGAMYAKYGRGRRGRAALPEELAALCRPRAYLAPDRWGVTLTVPLPLVELLYGRKAFAPGDRFFCNFYKISESPEIEHYASYHPIDSETPNFHRPSCFAEAVLTDRPMG